jgi:hypothetical protein
MLLEFAASLVLVVGAFAAPKIGIGVIAITPIHNQVTGKDLVRLV